MRLKTFLQIVSIFTLLIFAFFSGKAQLPSQTVRGMVLDKDSKAPLTGVTVMVLNTNPLRGNVTDEKGEFVIQHVPVGRHQIRVAFIGYNEQVLSNIEIVSGKENVLNISLEESVTALKEISIVGQRNKTQAVNEMNSISSRTFSVEETGRYAGSRNDVSRMAANYAGVSNGDDSRNDIVIRGNSPTGLLWKLEEMQIPTPSHFSSVGASGGPVSMLNYNVIANSDFMTGAFPAEYGNASSGVFDIKLRTGNNSKREYMFQIGALGTEMMLEGPFAKGYKGSYLINYRFSTTSILTAMGINFGYSGKADYQDMAFNFNLPLGDRTTLTLFGMGGHSIYSVLFKDKKESDFSPDGYINSNDHWISRTGVLGATLNYRISDNSYWKTVFGYSGVGEDGQQDSVSLANGGLTPRFRASNFEYKYTVHSYIKTKLNAKNKLKTGIILDHSIFQMRTRYGASPLNSAELADKRIGDGSMNLLQAYTEWMHSFTDRFSLNTGLHYQRLSLNGDQIIEPRAGLKWNFMPDQTLSFGYGLHSQVQLTPVYMVATQTPNGIANTNRDVKFSKSHQLVLGYNTMLTQNTALKIETYYQKLFDIPVESHSSSYSAVNEGMSYIFSDKDSLVNKGTGRNLGIEMTLEKFFSNGYYYLATLSLFDSKYKGSDGIERNSAFNGRYVFNVLTGKEFKLNEKSKLVFDVKFTTAGGKRYTPIDYEKSKAMGTAEHIESVANSEQFPTYFRTDFKLTWRYNGTKTGHEFFVNIDNAFNNKNVFSQVYDPNKNQLGYIYQLGVFPTFQYKLYF